MNSKVLPARRAAVLVLAFASALSGQNFSALSSPAEAAPPPWGSAAADHANPPGLVSQQPAGPLAEDYVLGPGDLLSVQVLEAQTSFNAPLRVGSSGDLHLPMAGPTPAAGLTVTQLETVVAERLRTYVHEPHVAVNVVEYRSRPVTVIGAVQTPGVQALAGERTLLEVLSEAGGLRPEAAQTVRITRRLVWGPLPLPNARTEPGGYSVAEVSLSGMLKGTDPAENLVIRPQDVIAVPRAEMVYVLGAVRQASGLVLEQRESLSVLEALSLAGGLAPKAAPERAKILRPGEEGAQERVEVAVNLKGILAGDEPDLRLGSEDVLFVPYSGAKIAAEKAVNAAITIGTGLLIWRR